jgi:ribosomal protein L11 methyltransferase
MPWLQVETELGQTQPEQLEALFEKLGAVAIWLTDAGNDPVLEPALGTTPLWNSTCMTALFAADADQSALTAALGKVLNADSIRLSDISDADWTGDWQRSLGPLQLGERLWVIQSSANTVPDGSVVIQLTPGLAFGTGEHPTTAMCVRWLENLGTTLRGKSVLDFGCGSGLLAIAALKLGAHRACAADIDPQALLASEQNATLNNCSAALSVCYPADLPAKQHDVLVANILSNTLIECGPMLQNLTAPDARIALSGVLSHQAEMVCSSWADWATLEVTDSSDAWVLISGTKLAKTE